MLITQGLRFCCSPCKKFAKWIHPLEIAQRYSDWDDVTDLSQVELQAFLTT